MNIGEEFTMAKFVLEDDTIESWDNIKEEKKHQISPSLMIEMRLIDAIMKISHNLSNRELNTDECCIMQLITGEIIPKCEYDGNCHKCVCHWYMNKEG